MKYVLDDKERLKRCIEALEEIKDTHSAEIVMNGVVVRDKAYRQAKECLDTVMKKEYTFDERFEALKDVLLKIKDTNDVSIIDGALKEYG